MIRSGFKMNMRGDAGAASTSVKTILRYYGLYMNWLTLGDYSNAHCSV